MLRQILRQYLGLCDWPSQLIAACGTGVLLGIACLLFPPLWVAGALIGGALTLAVVKRPELALLAILLVASTVIPEERVPVINVGPGRLYITDLILMTLFGLIVLRWLAEPDFKLIHTPLDWPLLALYGAALLATLAALLWSSLEFSWAIPELRVITYYLILFIVTNLVRTDHQLVVLVRGLLLLATFVAVAMMVQFVLGDSVQLLPGRVEALYTEGKRYGSIFRILPPGGALILVAFITSTVVLVVDESKPMSVMRLSQWSLLGVAVILTFNRSFWVGVGLALSLLAYLVRGQDRRRLTKVCLVVVLVAVAISVLIFSQPESRAAGLVDASLQRLGSLFSSKTYQAQQDSTLRWRDFEYKYALPQIASHPLIGLGLGARYRPFLPGIDYEGFDGRWYMHNAHLWMMLKSGLLGYLCLLWLSLAFLLRGFKYWRRIPNPLMKGSVLGFTLAYLGVLIGSIVNPMLMQWSWTPVIGLTMGLNEAVLRTLDNDRSLETGERVEQH